MSAVGPYMLESTLCPLAETATGNIAPDPASLKAAMEGAAALGAGMGLGRYEEGPKVVKYLLNNFAGRLLLDADGLNALAVLGPEALKDRACAEVVLTPHPKEFERLSGVPAAEAAAEPGACARAFAERYGVTVLLKGTATTVTDGKRVWYCDRGCARHGYRRQRRCAFGRDHRPARAQPGQRRCRSAVRCVAVRARRGSWRRRAWAR